ncbi:hypothetical protein LDL08_32690 [Nonomuraea glycinis]|uniref:Conjugal transfer protein TrbC n=1 Tax=Nonomuraea glycinis TaxID=2047744 RepID=A0A918ABE6_9ACTN|nr:hypothetical protein [Nonomuraea glycinis]MCA2180949.1 hypothetical protein [Nonomuraea glycinis]WSG69208.1 hypothetical protein OHA68_07135 [Nonomuraea glycinis]GGP13080.1 hypothetical protein GCM10012278_63430 [Nonomuraea glycinis]
MTHLLSDPFLLAGVATMVPDPGMGTPPPGSEKLLTALGWAAWIVTGVCVAGVMGVAARMALVHHRGEGGRHAVGLAWVMAACVLLGSASSLVGALLP